MSILGIIVQHTCQHAEAPPTLAPPTNFFSGRAEDITMSACVCVCVCVCVCRSVCVCVCAADNYIHTSVHHYSYCQYTVVAIAAACPNRVCGRPVLTATSERTW